MTVLRTEGSLSVGGRLSVISSAEIPLSPDRDPRQKWALIGGSAGFGLPLCLLIGLGLIRRRYDFSDETEWDIGLAAPLLGVLPDLRESDTAERRSAAARCVHQIRVLLGAWSGRRRSSVYLVTSTTAKEGKTSLTMSLGLSFAASGARTLVIDCDLVGISPMHWTPGS